MIPEVKTIAIIIAFVLSGLVVWIIATLDSLGDYRLLFAGALVGCAIIIIIPTMGLGGEEDKQPSEADEWQSRQRKIRRRNQQRRRENRF